MKITYTETYHINFGNDGLVKSLTRDEAVKEVKKLLSEEKTIVKIRKTLSPTIRKIAENSIEKNSF